MRPGARGFSLLELLIAVSLSVIVLMAVFGMMTSMFRFQVEGLKKSTVTGWSLASLMKMNKEIESASVMGSPSTNGAQANAMTGCTNWSRILTTGKMDGNQNVVVFYYCYDGAPNGTIRRLAEESAATVCPASPATPPVCSAAWGGANRTNDVIAVGVNPHSSGALVFTKDDSVGGVRVRFTVGEKTFVHVDGKPDVVNPQYMEFDTSITMSRPYLNTND